MSPNVFSANNLQAAVQEIL